MGSSVRGLVAAGGVWVLATGCPTPEPAPELIGLAVVPGEVEAVVGDSIQLRAEGLWSDETTTDMTVAVDWLTADPEEASIDDGGRIEALAEGQATVTATYELLAASALVTIGPAVLEQLVPTPLSFDLAGGEQAAITLTGRFGDGSLADVTDLVVWTSTDSGIATAEEGLVTAGGAGSAELTATLQDVSVTVPVEVAEVELLAIVVAPESPSLPLGSSVTFTATGLYSDGTELDLTGEASWSSSDGAHVLIDAASGAADAVGTGGAIIEAAASGEVGSTVATVVDAEVVGVAIEPDEAGMPLGGTTDLTAIATLSDASTLEVTASASWSSDDPLIARASNDAGTRGRVTSVSVGTATIRVSFEGFEAVASVTVAPASLVSLEVDPAATSIALGEEASFSVVGTYTDGSELDHTTVAAWASGTPGVATFPGGSTAVPVGPGTTTVTAAYGDLEGTASLTVGPAALVSIAVTPPTSELPVGALLTLTATGTYTTGAVTDITEDVFWASSAPGFVTVNNLLGFEGEATAAAVGTATVLASLSAITGAATVEAVPAAPVSVGILPIAPVVAVGEDLQLTAGALLTDGTIIDVTLDVTWASLDPSLATLANDLGIEGIVTGVGAGSVTVTATLGTIVGSTAVQIEEDP